MTQASAVPTPLVSIITPSLNQRRFIEHSIRSVEHQTYANLEHIVVDGGSTDGTIEVLRRHEGRSPLRWVSNPDRGGFQAISKGLRLANGDILACLNADDAYPPWAIEVAVATLNRMPDIDVVYGDGLVVDERTGRQLLLCVPPFEPRSVALMGSLVQPAVFFRRRVYEELGDLDDRLALVGDIESWLRGRTGTTFARINEVLAVERRTYAAASMSMARQMLRVDGEAPRFLRRLRARVRAVIWRRRLWLAFLMASVKRRGDRMGPWGNFLVEAELVVHPLRAALMFVPRVGNRFALDAIRSKVDWLGRGEVAPS